jgi:hypothetical protein
LKLIGSLSRLYSQNSSPYLHYRVAENIFCLAFEAEDLSRSDISVDARKSTMGIGLKTFLHSNGRTLQKIAEFNEKSPTINKLRLTEEKIHMIAELRNERLRVTKELYGLSNMCYHCITRDIGINSIYEFPMDNIDINNLRIIEESKKTITFTDNKNEYSFNLSKVRSLKDSYAIILLTA